jgi:glucose/mannose transport system permease protein
MTSSKRPSIPFKGFFLFSEYLVPSLILLSLLGLYLSFVIAPLFWTALLSLTASKTLPSYDWVGLHNYEKLFSIPRFLQGHLHLFHYSCFMITLSISIGFALALILHQKDILGKKIWQTLCLYPMAISFIVSGTVWKWLLHPDRGLDVVFKSWNPSWGMTWPVDPDKAIYAIVCAGVWQGSGLMMMLFLSSLNNLPQEPLRAAYLDGAHPFKAFFRITLPQMWPAFLSGFFLLLQSALKTFDLVVVLTQGGPGLSTDFPSTFMFDLSFNRGQIGLGSASAMIILLLGLLFLIPSLITQRKSST